MMRANACRLQRPLAAHRQGAELLLLQRPGELRMRLACNLVNVFILQYFQVHTLQYLFLARPACMPGKLYVCLQKFLLF